MTLSKESIILSAALPEERNRAEFRNAELFKKLDHGRNPKKKK